MLTAGNGGYLYITRPGALDILLGKAYQNIHAGNKHPLLPSKKHRKKNKPIGMKILPILALMFPLLKTEFVGRPRRVALQVLSGDWKNV
jgi:hypothetical protein